MTESAFIQLHDVSKNYGPMRVVEGLNLEVAKGEFLSLLGPSGSGKTTILMMLAGFERASGGTIRLDGQLLNDLPPHKRGMGVVFQNYALFPHMTVAENVAFPLDMRGIGRADSKKRVIAALERVRLGHLADRKPAQLSGGQQQRVALTRALVFEPKVILMDEPLGALDKQLREEMQLEIRALHRRLGLTIVFVTHDQSEALTMSDRIAIFDKGKISQIGAPDAVYDRPENRFVAQFIGETNLIECTLAGQDGPWAVAELPGGIRVRTAPPAVGAPAGKATLSIRPERLALDRNPPLANQLDVRVDDAVYQGDHIRLHLQAGALPLVARLERGARSFTAGETVRLSFDPAHCSVFPATDRPGPAA